jgi:hypothetical protein
MHVARARRRRALDIVFYPERVTRAAAYQELTPSQAVHLSQRAPAPAHAELLETPAPADPQETPAPAAPVPPPARGSLWQRLQARWRRSVDTSRCVLCGLPIDAEGKCALGHRNRQD